MNFLTLFISVIAVSMAYSEAGCEDAYDSKGVYIEDPDVGSDGFLDELTANVTELRSQLAQCQDGEELYTPCYYRLKNRLFSLADNANTGSLSAWTREEAKYILQETFEDMNGINKD